MFLKRLILAFLLILPLPAAAQFYLAGDDPAGRWMQITTPGYRIVYPQVLPDSLVLKYAEALEKYTPYVGNSAGMAPGQYQWGNTPVVLHAYTPWSNGSVAWAPRRMDLYTTSEPYTPLAIPWVDQLVIHELRHVSQMQLGYRGVLKPVNYLVGEMWNGAVAGIYSNKAVLEGDAVVAETALTNSGRGRQAAFMNYYRYAFDNGDWRNWGRWRYGSFKYPAPDHYELGYMMISGMRVFYDIPDWTARYYNEMLRNPWPLGKLNRVSKRLLGEKSSTSFRHIMESWQEVWEKEDSLNGPYINGVRVSAEPRFATDYSNLIEAGGILYAIKSGHSQAATLVSIDRNGNEKELCPVSASTSQYVYDPDRNRLWWTEKVGDLRWTLGGTARIRYMCLDDFKQHDFTTKGRYFTPCISPDGSAVSAVSYPVDGRWLLSVFNADDGSLLWEDECPFQITESVWGPEAIYAIGIVEGGFAFWKHPADGPGEWEQISPASAQQIEALSYEDNGLLMFTTDRSGLQQTCTLDPHTLECRQITNVKYGATDYVAFDGDVYYVAQERMGRMVYRLPEEALQPRSVRLDSLHSWWVADEMSRQELVMLCDTLPDPDRSRTKLFRPFSGEKVLVRGGHQDPAKRYSKLGHLVRLHSWAPIYFDYDEISSFSGEFSYSMVSPGLTGLFQNDLGTFYGQVGYSARPDGKDAPWRHSGHLRLNYSGLYPVFEAGLDFNDGNAGQYNWQITHTDDGHGSMRTTFNPVDKVPLLSGHISAWVPLSQSKGGVSRGLIPKLTYSISNNRFYNGAVDLASVSGFSASPAFLGVRDGKNVPMQMLSASLRAYSMLSRGESQTYPRWGIGAEIGGQLRPGLQHAFSPVAYTYLYGYLPGFTRVQGLRLNALAQYIFRRKEMFPEIRVSCVPRGLEGVGNYMAQKDNFQIKAGADYAIPIYVGDIDLFEGFFNIRNFLLIPHTDAAMFGNRFLGSSGVDITAEMSSLLSLFSCSMGVSVNAIYGGNIAELREAGFVGKFPVAASLIFSVDI